MEIILFVGGFVLGALLVFFAMKNAFNASLKSSEKSEEQIKSLFESIANKIIKENTQEFSTMSKERMHELLEPFKEKIEEIKKKFENNDQKFNTLDVHIKSVIETGNQISKETVTLTKALKSDNKTQGKWGELVLSKVLQYSGLRENFEYALQTSSTEGTPDATIFLPDKKVIYIDAKTNFQSYYDFLNSTDENEKKEHLKQFKEAIKRQIANLANKKYTQKSDFDAYEYILMFIPIESCYSLIFDADNQLFEYAWNNKIMLTSPSNLLASLKIINNFYQVDKQNKNAQDIADLAGKMYDKFADLIKNILDTKRNLDLAISKLMGAGNIITQIERLKILGAKGKKEIPRIGTGVKNEG